MRSAIEVLLGGEEEEGDGREQLYLRHPSQGLLGGAFDVRGVDLGLELDLLLFFEMCHVCFDNIVEGKDLDQEEEINEGLERPVHRRNRDDEFQNEERAHYRYLFWNHRRPIRRRRGHLLHILILSTFLLFRQFEIAFFSDQFWKFFRLEHFGFVRFLQMVVRDGANEAKDASNIDRPSTPNEELFRRLSGQGYAESAHLPAKFCVRLP